MAGNSSQNENTFLQKNLIGWVTFLWSASRCLFFIRPNTLLLCISLFVYFSCTAQIHKLKFISEYYYDENMKSCAPCQKCEHRQSHVDFLKNDYSVSLFLINNSLAESYFLWNPNFLLLHIFFFFSINQHHYNHNRFSKMSRSFCTVFCPLLHHSNYDRKKRYSHLAIICCAVPIAIVAPFQLRPEKSKIQLSVRCYAVPNTTGKKTNNLAGARSLLRPEKKSSSRLSGGCMIVITTGKKSSSHLLGPAAFFFFWICPPSTHT